MKLTQKQLAENQSRAQRGRDALEVYAATGGNGQEFLMVDLLADLMHYSHDNDGITLFELYLATARKHFQAEIKGEM